MRLLLWLERHDIEVFLFWIFVGVMGWLGN
jgi:hypothetical protein